MILTKKKMAAVCALSVLTLASAFFASCSFGLYFLNVNASSPDERASSVTELPASDLSSAGTSAIYSFVIITDPHFGSKRERNDSAFLDWFEKQLSVEDETLRPRFLVNAGDTMNDGRDSEADEYLAFSTEVKKRAAAAGFADYKMYAIMGNHDTYNDGWDVWKKKVWPYTSYYHFSITADETTDGFSYYFLDSGNGTLGVKQLENLEAVLPSDPRPKIIFCHYPVYAGGIFYYVLQDPMERARLLTLFANNNVKQYFAGHQHMGSNYTFKKFGELVVRSMVSFTNLCLVTVDEKTASVTYTQIELK